MPRDDHDDRPKKSWREIDQSREKGTSRSERPDRGADRLQKSQAYRNYKSQLNKLFDGGGVLPEALATKLGDTGVASEAKQRKDALAAILAAQKPKDVKAAVKAYETVFGFPDDEEALGKILDLSDEDLVMRALQTLSQLNAAGPLKRASSLKARLKTVQISMDDPEIVSAAKALLNLL